MVVKKKSKDISAEEQHLWETFLKESKVLASPNTTKPKAIIANTIKGKGVTFMENNNLWHYRSPQGQEFNDALSELNKG